MIDLLPLSIGIGLGISLLFSELFFLAPGGMIVPGYLALYMNDPLSIVLTLCAAFVTFVFVRSLTPFVILYGRRRTVLMILVGYLTGYLFRFLFGEFFPDTTVESDIIGFIIPGLIAIWLDRQGVVETVSTLLTVTVVSRLVLILFTSKEFFV